MKFVNKDITTIDYGIIIHGCNCSGGFGSGVAGAIAKKWPRVREEFLKNGTGKTLLGTVFFVPVSNNLWIANAYTQENYGNDGKVYASLNAINSSLRVAIGKGYQDASPVYMPRIGCGLGGLKWEDVSKIVESYEDFYDLEVTVCDYA